MNIASYVLISLLVISCLPSTTHDPIYSDYDSLKVPYRLFKPDVIHRLHWDLEETSGLSYYKNGELVLVEDERGKVYFINVETGKIIRKIKFGKGGDYEGVEVVDNNIWVMKSNGHFFSFSIDNAETADPKVYKSGFTSKNDLEGLGAIDGKLLVACKGDGDLKDIDRKGKGIYKMDGMEPIPYLFVRQRELASFVKGRKHFNKIKDFDPSAIAVNPLNKDIYILSADRILAVFGQDLKLKEVVRLSRKIFQQPEGICFAPDGTLYISSEGDQDRGELFTFRPLSLSN